MLAVVCVTLVCSVFGISIVFPFPFILNIIGTFLHVYLAYSNNKYRRLLPFLFEYYKCIINIISSKQTNVILKNLGQLFLHTDNVAVYYGVDVEKYKYEDFIKSFMDQFIDQEVLQKIYIAYEYLNLDDTICGKHFMKLLLEHDKYLHQSPETVYTFTSESKEKECLICYHEFKIDDQYYNFSCSGNESSHIFCKECIIRWTKGGKNTCPMCKKGIKITTDLNLKV